MVLEHREDGGVVRWNAFDALRQEVRAQLVADRLADEPECLRGQPSIRRAAGLVQLEFLVQQVAQTIQQLALQRMLRRRHRPGRITAERQGHRCLVSLDDQLSQRAGMLVLARQHVQPVLAIRPVTKAVRLPQRPVPRVPDQAIGLLDVQVDRDLANVVQQRGVGGPGGPGLGLRGLGLGRGAGRKQVGLPQFERVGHDLQTVVQHAARPGMVMRLRGRELLDQFGVVLQRRQVQRAELPTRQRGALPDVFQQPLPARLRQQRCGRLRWRQPFGRLDRRWRGGGGQRHPFALEQRKHGDILVMGWPEEPFGLFG